MDFNARKTVGEKNTDWEHVFQLFSRANSKTKRVFVKIIQIKKSVIFIKSFELARSFAKRNKNLGGFMN